MIYSVEIVKNRLFLEISVETVEGAAAAERGGADRIELCGNLPVGGVTPDALLMRSVREMVRIPIFAMIRPRAGDFVYSDAEFAEMKREIAIVKELSLDGVVLGILKMGRCVDVERTRELVEFARPLPVTFHRAFDEITELPEAVENVIQTGAKRILTSGGAKGALEGATVLFELIEAAGERIIIVPGAGISASNIRQIALRTRAREFHSGLSAALPYSSHDYRRFEAEVKSLANELRLY
ncbi:MAG TPA: copper homeostasis protein CutC [Candidatus Udaeobacter sp.]|nr:copper homeostasis protein CutC [Candidatus Udaeobacter sp.]